MPSPRHRTPPSPSPPTRDRAPACCANGGPGSIAPLTVALDYTGSATPGTDYAAMATQIVFASGITNLWLHLTALDDALTEGTETALVSIVNNAPLFITSATQSNAPIYILDDETSCLPGIRPVIVSTSQVSVNAGTLLTYRGKFARTRFERDCLAEYAEVFKTVCVDAAFYAFPRPDYLSKLAGAAPDDFRFGFKVTDTITIKHFPKLDRFGSRAGQPNPDYLNADLFTSSFLKSCETIRDKVGVLMFEFARVWPGDAQRGREFIASLDQFLGKLPKGWPYAVEMRNREWLHDDYFACLARHGVTHAPPSGRRAGCIARPFEIVCAQRRERRGIYRLWKSMRRWVPVVGNESVTR